MITQVVMSMPLARNTTRTYELPGVRWSFCESPFAGPLGPYHLRWKGEMISTLCGKEVGWDVDIALHEFHEAQQIVEVPVCGACQEEYKRASDECPRCTGQKPPEVWCRCAPVPWTFGSKRRSKNGES